MFLVVRLVNGVTVTWVRETVVPMATDAPSSFAVHTTREATHAVAKLITQLAAEDPVVMYMSSSLPITVGVPVPQDEMLGFGPDVSIWPLLSISNTAFAEAAAVDEDTAKSGLVPPAPVTESTPHGVEVPTPTFAPEPAAPRSIEDASM